MAQELASAMDKGELKKLLMKSKKEPVNCAVGMGDGKKSQPGLILLDRVKAPKAVLKELEKQFPGATNTRWGSVFVDTDLDAALVQLQLNKAASGIGKRLVKSLKGTGFTKVKVMLEDGSVAEEEADEEQAAASTSPGTHGNGAAQPQAAAPVQPSAAEPGATPPASGAPRQETPPAPGP
ncbi:MAG TPA: hypothetical protein VJY39_12465 [Acidisphaera sp.]|nr:hypothetical protein [Acidisphaera sp.]